MSKVRLSSFPEGTKVKVFPRVSDAFTAAPGEVGSGTVKDGEVSIRGLVRNAPYYAHDEESGRSVAFTAKDPEAGVPDESEMRAAAAESIRKAGGLGSPAPGVTVEPDIITGPRGSNEKRRRKPSDPNPQPFRNQQDVEGTPQRSDTPLGEVHEVDPDEVQPYESQEDMGNKQPQRSSTEFGQATPVDKGELQPAVRQEDAPKGMKQASATEEGSVEPVVDPSEPEQGDAKSAGRSKAKPRAKTTKK